METRRPVLSKIVVGGNGMGIADAGLLEQRAIEVALIEGRTVPNLNDWREAYRELHGRGNVAEDIGTIWVLGPDLSGSGREVGDGRLRNETVEGAENMGEELIREGLEEAEHERMLLAHFLPDESDTDTSGE